MKSNFLFICVMAFLAVSTVACKKDKGEAAEVKSEQKVAKTTGAATYSVNAAASKILWEGYKLTGKHNGTVAIKDGNVKVENGQLVGGMITLDMGSINVLDLQGDEKAGLEAHLKGTKKGEEDHFFNVAQYPTAKFEITGVKQDLQGTAGANVEISGNLTLKDQTHNITFPANFSMANNMANVTAPKFNIDRTKWNVKYASKSLVPNIGDKAINDEIGLSFNLSANK